MRKWLESGRAASASQRRPSPVRSKKPLLCAALAFSLLWLALAGSPARAEGFDRGSDDIFLISIGTFLIDFDTDASLDSETLGRGTDIDFENDLGLTSNQTRTRLEGYWRMAPKHRLDFAGYFYSRKAERALDKQIQWGDVVYDVGAEMETEVKSQLFKIDYKYSFVRTSKLEFAFSAGLSTILTKAELAGQGTVSGGGSATFERSSKSVVAPIPVFGLHGEWCMHGNLYLRGGAEYFAVNVSGWEGKVTDLRGSMDWYPFKHFGFGAGYNVFHIDGNKEGDLALDFRYGFEGLLGYATYVF
jgi:hypothetical protein